MASFLQDTIDKCQTALTAAGVRWANDPGKIQPNTVMIELPEFTSYAKAVADIRIRLRVCGSPPGNKATNKYILDTVETILASTVIVESGSPGTADYGNQTLPTYDLVARVGTNR
jgi:hypothetical protein